MTAAVTDSASTCRDVGTTLAGKGPGKTQMGMPDPTSPRGVVLALEARRSRHRLYPVTIVYTSYSLAVFTFALRTHRAAALSMTMLGLAVWTYVEYLAHRYILHGRFPYGRTWWSRFLNRTFAHLHWQHHQRPWDGNHINGTITDTIWAVGPLALLTFLAPAHTVPVFFAAFLLGYVIEEWCHHSVHYYVLPWPWFRRLKARHFYHHSRRGADILFGLSNGFWDDVIGTGMPLADRDATSADSPRCDS
jgi:sterol desaturase/sphingolipid hydroxylase (fatty acid hydroxylase superfamily)